MSKYHAKKIVTASGEKYDSKKEFRRGQQLKALALSAKISDLQRQVKYELIPAQRDTDGKCIERACCYVADFVYKDSDGHTVVEDCKGVRTPEYIIRVVET